LFTGESFDGVGENSSQYDHSQSSITSSNHENGVNQKSNPHDGDDQDSDEDDDDDDDDEENDNEQMGQVGDDHITGGGYSCELCQVSYSNAKELRKHVSEHIINGGNTGGNNVPSSLQQALQAPPKSNITAVNSTSALQQQLQAPLKPLGPISDDLAAINNHLQSDDSSSSDSNSTSSSQSSSASSSKQQQQQAEQQQQFAAISQEYKCRVCGTVCADQLEMMTCLISHTANVD
jgi:hypothetical protein